MAIVYTYPRISPGNKSLWVLITDNEDEQKTKNINFEDFAKLIPEIIELNDFKLCGHPFVPVCPVPINDGDGIFYNASSQTWKIQPAPSVTYELKGLQDASTSPFSFDIELQGSDGSISDVKLRPGANINFSVSSGELTIGSTGGGGGGSITVTDNTTTVTPASKLTFVGATVTGTTPDATITINGNEFYVSSVPALTNVVGTWGNINPTYVSSGGQDPAKNIGDGTKTFSDIFDLIFFAVQNPVVNPNLGKTVVWSIPKSSGASLYVVGEQTSVTLSSVSIERGTVGSPAQEPGHTKYYGETTNVQVTGGTLSNPVSINIIDDGRQDANPTIASNTVIEQTVTIPAYGTSYTWNCQINVAGTNSNPPQPFANEPYLDSQGQVTGYWKNNLGAIAASPPQAPAATLNDAISVTGAYPIYFGTGTSVSPYNSNNYLAANFALPSATNPIPRGSSSWTNPYQALWEPNAQNNYTIKCFQPFPQITSVNQLHCFMVSQTLIQGKTVNIKVWDALNSVYVNNNSFWTTGPTGTFSWPVGTGYSNEVFVPYYSTDGNQGGDPSTNIAKYEITIS